MNSWSSFNLHLLAVLAALATSVHFTAICVLSVLLGVLMIHQMHLSISSDLWILALGELLPLSLELNLYLCKIINLYKSKSGSLPFSMSFYFLYSSGYVLMKYVLQNWACSSKFLNVEPVDIGGLYAPRIKNFEESVFKNPFWF